GERRCAERMLGDLFAHRLGRVTFDGHEGDSVGAGDSTQAHWFTLSAHAIWVTLSCVTRAKLPNPASLTEFPFNLFMRLLATGDVRATAAQHASFRRFADLGDPLADDLVAMMQRLPTGEGR